MRQQKQNQKENQTIKAFINSSTLQEKNYDHRNCLICCINNKRN